MGQPNQEAVAFSDEDLDLFKTPHNLSPIVHPRFLIRYQCPKKREIHSDFIFLVHFNYHHLHFVNPRKTLSFLPGQIYEFTLLFPSGHQEKLSAALSYQFHDNGGFGLKLLEFTGRFRQEMGKILLDAFPDYSPKEIRKLGFLPTAIHSFVTYQVIHHEEDYQQVLELRKLAYGLAGKLTEDQSCFDMRDEFDRRSLILVARHRQKIVASMRLILNREDEKGEHEQFITFPKDMPSNGDIIEITRVCTHPDYRGSSLLQGLFQYASKISVSLGRNWILGSSTQSLLPLYRRIGFRATGLRYIHDTLNFQAHIVFIGQKHDILLGRTVGPIHWNLIYREVYLFALDRHLFPDIRRQDRLRIHIYLKIGYIMNWILNKLDEIRLRRMAYKEETRCIVSDRNR